MKGVTCYLYLRKNLGVIIQQVVKLLISVQGDTKLPHIPWDFVGKSGENISFEYMNDVILESIKIIKNDDVRENTF